MNKIIIKSISIKNLYGYAKAEFEFDEKMNVIEAPTGFGKSNIINSILFALGFGKSNYQPSIDGYKIKDLESSVDMVLNVNGLQYNLNVTSVQKWKVVDKESEKKSYIGTDTIYTFDGCVCKYSVYKERIESLFSMNYDTIEMLIDIKYFNSDINKWKWNNRREFIFKLLDIDNKTAELANDERFNLISTDLRKGKTEIEIRKILNTEKQGIEDGQKKNAIVINEKADEITKLSEIDYEKLKNEKVTLKAKIDELYNATKDNQYTTEKQRLTNEIAELKFKIREMQQKNNDVKYTYDNKLLEYKRKISSAMRELDDYIVRHTKIINDSGECDIDLMVESERAFDQSKAICPTCKRTLEPEMVAILINEFQSTKDKKIAEITARRSELGQNKAKVDGLIETLNDKLSTLKSEMTALEEQPCVLENTKEIELELQKKQKQFEDLSVDNSEQSIIEEKNRLSQEYESVIKQLSNEDRIVEIKREISDLQANSRELAKQDSVRIQKVNQLKDYLLAKVELANTIVNDNFEGVTFKLFNLNGALAENSVEPTCVAMLNGVEYDKQSNGQKIYSDICVAKSLRKLLNINLFMFVDEKQSMTLPYACEYQTIELVTSNNRNINAIRICDIYTIDDTIKGE